VRGAYYGLISALSGTQTMALCSYDEAYTIPSKKAALISLRTMQMLVEEMGLADTWTPLPLVLRRVADKRVRKKDNAGDDQVDAQGGMVRLVADGTIQREVSRQAYILEKKLQSGEMVKSARTSTARKRQKRNRLSSSTNMTRRSPGKR